ncbi:MAG: penicillin-binding transpeptidase domain-containing protein [Thermomicrobiales bacterium]
MNNRKRTYNSPYAGPPERAKPWPFIAGTLIIVCFLAASGLLAQSGLSRADEEELSLLSQNGRSLNSSPESAEPTETPAPTNTPPPVATEADIDAPSKTVASWFGLWANGDFTAMYGMLASSSRSVFSLEDFQTRYADIQREAGIESVSATMTGDVSAEGRVPLEVTISSALFPDLVQQNQMTMVNEDDKWLVVWAPSLIFQQLGDTGCIDYRGELTSRGRILDRNGNVMAEDADVSRVGIVPGELVNPDETFQGLSSIVDIPAADIAAKLEREGIDPSWFVPIKDLPGEQSAEVLNQLAELPGVAVRRATARFYPYGAVAAHVTGWVSRATEEDVLGDATGRTQPDQIIGQAGLEYGANELLSGKPGGTLLIVDCGTRADRELITESDGSPAQDIYLTIDIELQKQVDKDMAALQGNERGAAVILDPQSGAVLALVSHPSFDPNDALTNSFDEAERTRIDDPTLRPMADRATFERYPTGSIFKVITTAAAMKYLGYTGDTPIDCPASFSIGDQTWDDWVVENGLSAQGNLTLHSGLVQSCNTVFYQVGADLDDMDPNALPDMTKAFGLGAKTGIPYFPEIAGTVPDPEWKQENIDDGWATGDAINLAIGQGYLEATPLQMANVYASIANGGTLLQPYIVDKTQLQGTDESIQVGERIVIRELPLTEAQITELQSALREQTSNDRGVGSSKVFGDFDWAISGKTGTAQNGAEDGKPHSWFAAFGPGEKGDEPTIASCVLVEQTGEGVAYAAPVTRNIYEWYIDSDLADESAEGVEATPPADTEETPPAD